jgi:soluble lytic murein transglycosylase
MPMTRPATDVPGRLVARLLVGLVACLLWSVPLPSVADDYERLASERKTFLAARKALLAGKTTRFRELAGRLHDYPLHPYLEYWALERRLKRAKVDEVEAMLERLADSPLQRQLRRQWLDRLAGERRWDEYVAAYRDGFGTTAACRYHDALRRLGRVEEAWAGVPALWLVGRSQGASRQLPRPFSRAPGQPAARTVDRRAA